MGSTRSSCRARIKEIPDTYRAFLVQLLRAEHLNLLFGAGLHKFKKRRARLSNPWGRGGSKPVYSTKEGWFTRAYQAEVEKVGREVPPQWEWILVPEGRIREEVAQLDGPRRIDGARGRSWLKRGGSVVEDTGGVGRVRSSRFSSRVGEGGRADGKKRVDEWNSATDHERKR